MSKCTYCGSTENLHRDHIIPRILGGLNLGQNNIAQACQACGQIKGGMMPDAIRAMANEIRALALRYDIVATNVDLAMRERGLKLPSEQS